MASAALDAILKPMLDRPFDPSNFVDVRERPLTANLRCSLISPLQSNQGCALVTTSRVYFQPAAGVVSSALASRADAWALADIVATARRYNGLRDVALELFLRQGPSVLLAFETHKQRESVMGLLPTHIPCHTDPLFVTRVAQEWSAGTLSNFEYLLALNSAAGRTFHDLSRYPVVPWIIADYSSSKLDLKNEATFRDLSKPIGALNQERLDYFKNRLKGMHGIDEPFLYGTHYSAPGYVLYYLVRSMPEHMLCLQNGKFDAPDRMFHSLDHCFSSIQINHADVKELIPEFYDPAAGFDFLINARNLPLGSMQMGERVNDVTLPPWAKSPRDFLKKNRKALESDHVTKMLPQWIDLIFGVKSRGDEALAADNLFHRMAYMGPSDLASMETEEEQMQSEFQASEFGIVPDLLFSSLHPQRQTDIDWGAIVVPDTGRSSQMQNTENEEGGSTQNDGRQRGQSAEQWEMLDTPKGPNGSASEINVIQSIDSDTSVEVSEIRSSGVVATSNKLNMVASPTAKAKHSWQSNGRPSHLDTMQENTSDDKESKMDSMRDEWVMNASNSEQAHFSHRSNYPATQLSLSGSGDGRRDKNRFNNGTSPTNGILHNTSDLSATHAEHPITPNVFTRSPSTSNSRLGWDMKTLASKAMHGDIVSGCRILMQEGSPSYLVTTSLDGSLMIHVISDPQGEGESNATSRRSFSGMRTSTLSRFTSTTTKVDKNSVSSQIRLSSFRTHSAADPLACLALASDGHGGNIVFAGGHDDVVIAYGINSACALASVYSHRDAVTGIDIFRRSHFGQTILPSEKSTHIMVTGSWDATVKVWSVSIAAGEAVTIDREPLAELFDADSSVVCVSAIEVPNIGVAICAGCDDGSFVVWLFRNGGVREVVHKDTPKHRDTPCLCVKWRRRHEDGATLLFAGFGSGKVASFSLVDGILTSISKVSVGVAVQSLDVIDTMLLVGCSDGGLRLIQLSDEAVFEVSPILWNAVNGKASPSIRCISMSTALGDRRERYYYCATGAENGSIVLCELKEAT
eukprot:scaffold10075_cov57-Attheya_sp.AAC.2